METEFIEGKLPTGHRYDFDPYIFNLPDNLTLQAKDNWHSIYAIRTDKKLIRAQVHFHVQDETALSPYKNPFGSFEFSDALTPKELFDFIQFAEESLKKKKVKRIEIKSYPQLYHAERSSLLFTFLINQGYSISSSELSACIPVNQTKLFDSLSSFEKRRLRKQKQASLRFKTIPVQRLREVYDFIESCRRERNQSMSMTIGQMEAVLKTFPDKLLLFGVFEGNAFAAASISIRINKNILYNFYPAHSKAYDALSPVVGLTEGIYEFCQQENINLLDLGTSALRGRPHFSLLDFKIHMGAKPTPKITFVKDL